MIKKLKIGQGSKKVLENNNNNNSNKIKAISVTVHADLYGYEILNIPHCLDNWLTDGGKVVSLTRRPRSTPQKHYFSDSGIQFC
jgi:hypothetical protein